jgi:hypothetical protein
MLAGLNDQRTTGGEMSLATADGFVDEPRRRAVVDDLSGTGNAELLELLADIHGPPIRYGFDRGLDQEKLAENTQALGKARAKTGEGWFHRKQMQKPPLTMQAGALFDADAPFDYTSRLRT